MKLRILYASTTGTARLVAQAIAFQLEDAGPISIDVRDMADAAADTYTEDAPPTLFCVATYGAGDLADAGLALYDDLAVHPRYLGHFRYGIVALGDSSHGETFCGGATRLDERLLDLGAQRVGEVLQLDALEDPTPERTAAEWSTAWWTAVTAHG